jgi:hypothetical protein
MKSVTSLISYSAFMRFYDNICERKRILFYLYLTYLIKLNSNIFRTIRPFSPYKINRHFGGTHRLHLQGRRICRGRYQLYLILDGVERLRRHGKVNQKGFGRKRLCPSFSITAFVWKEPRKLTKIVYQNSHVPVRIRNEEVQFVLHTGALYA